MSVPFTVPPRVEFRGVPIEFGDAVLVVPSFNLQELRDNAEVLSAMDDQLKAVRVGDGNQTIAFLDLLVQAALGPLQRNYPGLAPEWLARNVDMNSMMELYMALSGATGITSPGKLTRGEALKVVSPDSP